MKNTPNDKTLIDRRQCNLLLTASGMTYLLITMGGIVCLTGTAVGCPDWPGCFGQIVPPMQSDAIIEYLHRFIAALTSPLIIIAAIVGWRKYRATRWVSRPPIIAIGFLLAVIVFGALAVLRGIPPVIAVIDLGSALVVLALMIAATVVAFSHRHYPGLADRLAFTSPFAQLSLLTFGGVFIVLVSGVLVASSGSINQCLSWTLYNEPLALVDWQGWLLLGRRILAAATSVLIAATVFQAWRTQRGRHAVLRAATILGIVFLLESILGLFIVVMDSPIALWVINVATAAALWAMTVILVVLAGLELPITAGEQLEKMKPRRILSELSEHIGN